MKTEYFKCLWKSLVFILVLLLIFIILELRLRSNIVSHESKHYNELFNSMHPADIVIFGSSSTVHAINPLFLEGMKSAEYDTGKIYNFGLQGFNPSERLQWYNKLFRNYYEKPSLVILCLDWFNFSDSAQENNRKIVHDARFFPINEIFALFKDKDINRGLLIRNISLLHNSYENIMYLLWSKRKWGSSSVENMYNGYLPRYDTISDIVETRSADWNLKVADDLRELINTLKEDDIEVILVRMPNYHPGINMIGSNASATVELAKELSVPYLDYNETIVTDINNTKEFFADWVHMNDKGASAFSAILKRDIEMIIKE